MDDTILTAKITGIEINIGTKDEEKLVLREKVCIGEHARVLLRGVDRRKLKEGQAMVK